MDWLMVLPRTVGRAIRLVVYTFPEQLDNAIGKMNGGSIIAGATENITAIKPALAISTISSEGSHHAKASSMSAPAGHLEATKPTSFLGLKHLKGLRPLLGYFQSKWALGTFVSAIVLNRTLVYGSSRRPITINWPTRLALRLVPIILFLYHTKWLLEAIRCQTTPESRLLRNGRSDRDLPLDFTTNGGSLYILSSTLLFWQDDCDSCSAVSMARSAESSKPLIGSLSLLWPLFKTLCLSRFIETLSCAVQGTTPLTETGMTIFEHSLAFSEAEAMITSYVESASAKGNATYYSGHNATLATSTNILDSSTILGRANTPPEVLLIALISCLNHIASNVLGILGMQGRFRLINTGVWGILYIGTFIWSFVNFANESPLQPGILKFPTACIVGYIPHILILVGMCMCASIYILAFLLCTISPPRSLPPPRSFRGRLAMARDNMQANIHLSTIRISLQEDFYATLIKIGFAALTAASEAVFLNEGRSVSVSPLTWVEQDRLQEIISARPVQVPCYDGASQGSADGPLDAWQDSADIVMDVGRRSSDLWRSGYAKEQKTQALKHSTKPSRSDHTGDGVGLLQRGGRWVMVVELFKGIFWLHMSWLAIGLISVFHKVGIAWRPQWLSKFARENVVARKKPGKPTGSQSASLEFWLLSDDGVLSLPSDENVDVEAETRKRLQYGSHQWGEEEEEKLDSNLYGWWSHGGWWGEQDGSGEYRHVFPDDDTTSVFSMSSATTDTEWESDGEDGRRTPRQSDFYSNTRETTPASDPVLDASDLARLLNPAGPEEREISRNLARHLASDRVLTRSRYRSLVERENSKVLTSTCYRPGQSKVSNTTGELNPADEAELLEQLIIAKRSALAKARSPTRDTGGENSDLGGPQCVVCQSNSRVIIVWPCRCLSLCEDCRVSLAMNNFRKCVCCRSEVSGFSRIFIP